MRSTGIDHVNIRIPENGVEKAVRFYSDLLGFEPLKLDLYQDGERTSFAFGIGDDAMLHVRPKPDFQPPDQSNYDHFCIRLDEDIDTVREKLEENSVEIRRKSTPWGAHGRAPAIYVEDPFGYVIELKEDRQS